MRSVGDPAHIGDGERPPRRGDGRFAEGGRAAQPAVECLVTRGMAAVLDGPAQAAEVRDERFGRDTVNVRVLDTVRVPGHAPKADMGGHTKGNAHPLLIQFQAALGTPRYQQAATGTYLFACRCSVYHSVCKTMLICVIRGKIR